MSRRGASRGTRVSASSVSTYFTPVGTQGDLPVLVM
jgi:hypothetical protein